MRHADVDPFTSTASAYVWLRSRCAACAAGGACECPLEGAVQLIISPVVGMAIV